jgi:arylsulfatase A-like enzyme
MTQLRVGVAAALSALTGFGCSQLASDGVPRCDECNVLLVLVDTLRADHLPCYGYERDTAPSICGLADRSLLFEQVTATSSWTKPSTASLLSGLYAKSHGALSESQPLPDDVTILPELLRARGYATHAFSGNGIVGPDWNFDQGYDGFVQFDDPVEHIRSDTINARAVPFLRGLEEPFFLFVHYVDPHDPYTPPEAARHFSRGHPRPTRPKFDAFVAGYRVGSGGIEQQRDFYDDEILFNDRSVGELLSVLEERGLSDRTVVVVTSDHGEEFFEHGAFSHRKQLYEESLRVPLLMRIPSLAVGRRIRQPVSLVDVLPTLLDVLDVPDLERPQGLDGVSAFALPQHPGVVYAEHDDFGHRLVSMRDGATKLIVRTSPIAQAELFRLGRDPGEQQPGVPSPEQLAQLRAWSESGRRTDSSAGPTEEQQQILRKLGYAE